ncbi:hypothetical protein [Alkaliphilus hydrothermalis]|uniref:High-affinity Fe2+/Pb2+ permease n=1 Tax=Alkaliphilus hydrothermalis TaxID=1482730 RepID=A0ABS2NN09_9FIRM|nr:hypothetical protein [Alkaliphilus hydrothermalis]MBM7614320.1 high-affinity Fe2+/Pb2+ permease [Alkaliphilus hydrothermalis]
MQHYSKEKWNQYIFVQLDETEAVVMEEHLYSCDDCMNTYLSLLEASDIPQGILSQDFTDQVICKIQLEDSTNNRPKERDEKISNIIQLNTSSKNQLKLKRREVFKYYTVAASITMVLMYSGFFNVIASGIPRATNEIVTSTKNVEKLVPVGWSQRWMDTTLETLDSIKDKQGSEENEN